MKRVLAFAIVLCLVAIATFGAGVKTQQKNQVKFSGALGTVVGLFGGKAAREGVVETVAVSGDRMMTTSENNGQIIDLAEEKVYDLDLRNKTYKVTTFDELRRQMQEAQDRAAKNQQKTEQRESKEPQKEYQVDVDTKETGQRKAINGFDCREIITTISVHEKGKTMEQAGGVVMTADSWLTQPIPAMKEIIDFQMRYAKKLMGWDPQIAAEQMAAALAAYPGLKDAMAKMRSNSATLNGTPIQTTMTVESVKTADQVASEEKASSQQSGGGGLGGLVARRLAKKKDEGGDKSRSTFMTTINEVMSVATDVDASAVAMPAGFRQK